MNKIFRIFNNKIGDYFGMSEKKVELSAPKIINDSQPPSVVKKNTVKIANKTYKLIIAKGDQYGKNILNQDIFEEGINFYNLINFFLRKNSTVFDVGACIGMTSLCFHTTGKVNKIYAFEPTEPSFTLLNRNLKINKIKEAKTYKIAIDSKNGKLFMNKFNKNIAANMVTSKYAWKTNEREKCNSTSLDTFIAKAKIKKIDFIKIDVEGNELNVLTGMKKILKSFDPFVYIEFNSALFCLVRNLIPLTAFKKYNNCFKYIFWHKKDSKLTLLNNEAKIKEFLVVNFFNGFVDNLLCFNKKNKLKLVNVFN